MCGESVIRAAAFEHRLAAVVADPGVRDAWSAFPEIYPASCSPAAERPKAEAQPHLEQETSRLPDRGRALHLAKRF